MSIRLAFHGASGSVTGSCFVLDTGAARVAIDCGMFQGPKAERELNYRPFPFVPARLDAVLLTHAHIDHSGLLPKLVTHGFNGPIHATQPTVELCSLMLPDSGYIQEMEVEQLNRRNQRRGRDQVKPIYTAADAVACMEQFRPVDYCEWIEPAPGIRARYWNAGHLLGSASIEVEATASGRTVRILFSGDIGPDSRLLHPDPEAPRSLDYVLCESTYGDRDRIETTVAHRRQVLLAEAREAQKRGGALLIPSFAVERTQELLVDLVALIDAGELPPTQIFIDSPLATKISEVFSRHVASLNGGGEALAAALNSPHVHFTPSVEESKALNQLSGFHIVIAASGMAEAGRIRHHLRARLWRRNTTVLFVGFQAAGTLGRNLLDGATVVRIHGEEIKVEARIRALDLYSGHADGPELAAWIGERLPIRHQLFLVHGEGPAFDGLAQRVGSFLLPDAVRVPRLDEINELTDHGAVVTTAGAPPPRVAQEAVGRRDASSELSNLLLDIEGSVNQAADERARAVILRRIRRALEERQS